MNRDIKNIITKVQIISCVYVCLFMYTFVYKHRCFPNDSLIQTKTGTLLQSSCPFNKLNER